MKTVVVYTPSRLSVFVMNMNRLKQGVVDGGGIAISITRYSKISITSVQNEKDVIISHNSLAIQYYINKFRQSYCLSDHYHIDVQSNTIPHTGEGSTNSIIIGLLKGLFSFHNIKVSDEDIYDFYANDVVEEHNGCLEHGYSSGAGAWSVLKGGIVLLDEKAKLIRTISMSENFKILLIRPKDIKSLSYQMESTLIHNTGSVLDLEDADLKKSIFSELVRLDCDNNSNQKRVLQLLTEFQKIGSKVEEFNSMNRVYEGLYDELSLLGNQLKIELHGLSSLGPTYYFIDESARISSLSSKINPKLFQKSIYSISNGLKICEL